MFEAKYIIATAINQVEYDLVGYFDTETNQIIFGLYDVVLGGRYLQVGQPKNKHVRCTCGEILFKIGKKFPKGYTTIYCPNCGKEHTVENIEK